MLYKSSQQLNTVNYFCKKLHLRCFTGFWIRLRLSSLNKSLNKSLFFLLLFPLWINKVQKQSFTDVLYNIFLKKFAIFTEKHLRRSLFVSELYKSACKPANLFKKDSNTGVFLWILQNFWEQLFLYNTFGSCFLKLCLKPVRTSPWRTKLGSLFLLVTMIK